MKLFAWNVNLSVCGASELAKANITDDLTRSGKSDRQLGESQEDRNQVIK